MGTLFARTEQGERSGTTSTAELDAKLERLRGVLAAREAPAAILTGAAAVAWITGGITNPIERGHPASPLWIVVTPQAVSAVSTNVELPRLEEPLAALGIPLRGADWFEPDGMTDVAAELAGAAPGTCLHDEGQLGAGDDDLVAIRLTLLPAEQARLRALGADAASALEESLRAWEPGETDFQVQARVAERLERVGALGVCLFVGGDERVERFRHPLAVDAPVRRLVMAVVVAERGGLHAATTRFASAGKLPASVAAAQAAVLEIEAAILDACRPGATYGEVLQAMDAAYARSGHAGVWRQHYQGGPVGYRQREFELVPTQTSSRWYSTWLEEGHAVGWNPSVAGGGKVEDTFLVGAADLTSVTTTGPGWPTVGVGGRSRPAVLDVRTGAAA